MIRLSVLKKIMALLLLASFFLPLSRCQLIESTDPKLLSSQAQEKQTKQLNDAPSYYEITPSAAFNPKQLQSWIMIIAFFWPIVLWSLYSILRANIKNRIILLEPLFCIGSAFYIGQALAIGEILYGGYLAAMALTMYFLLSIHDAYRTWVTRAE